MLFIIIITLLSGCTSPSKSNCSGVYELSANWYEEHMDAAGIYPLCRSANHDKEQYRFTWLRTFHNPIFVTLTKQADRVSLSGIRLDGKGGYEPGKVIETKSVNLSQSEFEEFKALLNQIEFWNLLTENELRKKAEEETDVVLISLDGAKWILEGADSDHSHAVDRSSYLNDSFKNVALFLLHKSQLDINGHIY